MPHFFVDTRSFVESEKAQARRSRRSAPARRMLAGLLLIVLAVFLLLPP
ncbi:MAG: hypothetical protein HY783_06730, partial [Chloroflexi bacterium]|nr:hypothetical protein [Chloroflexota bacterium]